MDFVYPENINLNETVMVDGVEQPRYGRRLNPVKDEQGVHQPLRNGQLFDRLDPLRVIKPKNIREVTTADVTSTGRVVVKHATYLPGGGMYGD